MDRGAWEGYSPWGHKESDTTERLSLHFKEGFYIMYNKHEKYLEKYHSIFFLVYVHIVHCVYISVDDDVTELRSLPFFSYGLIIGIKDCALTTVEEKFVS